MPTALRLDAAALAWTLLLVSQPSYAQGAAATPPAVALEEIKVTGQHYVEEGGADSASQGSATQALIDDRPILRPGELLELVPGLIITQHSGAGKANQYFLRGFNLDHGTDFQTTVDGIPVNLRTHGHGQGYTDLNFLIPELVGRVDYFKGPYFAQRGDFASAGGAELHLADQLPQQRAILTLGTTNYQRAVVAGTPALGEGRLLYGLELFRDDGPWVRPDDYRRFNGVLRYSAPLGAGTFAVTAMGYRGTWNATDQIPLRAVQAGTVDRFGGVLEGGGSPPTTGGESERYSLAARTSQPLGGGRLELTAYAVRYRLNLFSNFTYFLDDPENGDQFEQSDQRWMYGASGRYLTAFSLAGLETSASAGFEARLDRLKPVGLYHTARRQRLETVRQDDVTQLSGGLWAEASVQWLPWLRSIAGLRYDRYSFDVTSSRADNSGDGSDGIASPKLSLVAGPFAGTELFLNGGLGFHSNDARGVTTRTDPKSAEAVDPVTPLVRSRGAEAGVRTAALEGLVTSLSLWALELDSELLFVGDAGTTEASRPSRRLGLEWSSRYRPLRWLLFDLDVAWSRARFTAPDPGDPALGDAIPGSIETAVAAGVTLQELGPVTASLFVRHFGPRALEEGGAVRSDPSTVLNAQVTVRLHRHLSLSAELFNALDARVDDITYFYGSRLPGEPASGVDDLHFHPAQSRTLRVQLIAGL